MTHEQASPEVGRRGSGKDYQRLLEAFGGASKPNAECLTFLLSQGYTRGQARNALYRFRQRDKATGHQG